MNDKVAYDLAPDAPFSYRCNGCAHCCHNALVRVTPYEVARLSRALGLSTTDFIARHTRYGGTALAVQADDDDACVFLGPAGCSVYADRPLVCRLYPLSMKNFAGGGVRYGRLAPHPASKGEYGTDGTAAGHAASHGVPEMRASKALYIALYNRMAAALAKADSMQLERAAELRGALADMADGEAVSPLIDVDATVANYCAHHDLPPPSTLAESVELHIAAIDEMLRDLEGDASRAQGSGP